MSEQAYGTPIMERLLPAQRQWNDEVRQALEDAAEGNLDRLHMIARIIEERILARREDA